MKEEPKRRKIHCPSCDDGTLTNRPSTFERQCDKCFEVFEKRCPCYFEKEMCHGCQYYAVCARRPNAKITLESESPAWNS